METKCEIYFLRSSHSIVYFISLFLAHFIAVYMVGVASSSEGLEKKLLKKVDV